MQHPRCKRSNANDRRVAREGLEWLQSTCLRVSLIPAPEPRHRGHMIRVVVDQNPPWYSRMCAARNFTGPGRRYVFRALRRVIRGWYDPRGLEDELMQEITSDLEAGYDA